MLLKKIIPTVVIALGLASFTSSAVAAAIVYTDRGLFEGALQNVIIDDFSNDDYDFLNTDVVMKNLSAGSIGYESTYFGAPDWNIVQNSGPQVDTLCWGCNGTGMIILDDTTIGSADGVFGFGLDIIGNSTGTPYDAFVTYGDGSTENFDLGTGAKFFGLTSDLLIKTVHFGLENAGTTNNGNFTVDNVTIGNLRSTTVPEPAPLALLGFGLLGLGLARKRRN
ncbi:PEP-CTERM sorting domain-containing protein [Paremcibacter congregatus]|uniref:PEP-CTERM sorting domain-containing protein n=1 Tax=Paremcibacter congregatus TaxID=2043170 RepID=UPI0030EE0E55|tara:strand:+ start:1174 stop:1842 length:669 start_codon:yes stop_codon:yes gene_type:complete